MIALAYGIQENPGLRGLTRHYLETRELPASLRDDKNALTHLKDRMQVIRESLGALEFYASGVQGGSSMTLVAELAKKGDEDSLRQLNQVLAYDQEHSTPLLREIHENFGNGMLPIGMEISELLRP